MWTQIYTLVSFLVVKKWEQYLITYNKINFSIIAWYNVKGITNSYFLKARKAYMKIKSGKKL